ncbi:MAG: helix-turn-helix domain-containing protein [Chloroflexales bacterium]|nr:helix-turn-helix domain-containing protein [Chloroflexales bacterium]
MELPRAARRAAKARLVAGMQAGLSWREAAAAADITVTEDTAHRLRRRVRQEGELALEDHRQGVAYKLPPPVRQWIVTYCQEHPHTTSRVLQGVLREHCDVLVSLGYLNQVRASLGVGYQRPPQGKKV